MITLTILFRLAEASDSKNSYPRDLASNRSEIPLTVAAGSSL